MSKRLIIFLFVFLFSSFSMSQAKDMPASDVVDLTTVAIAITQDGIVPQQVYIPKNQASQLYVLAKFSGDLTISGQKDSIACKKNKLQRIQLPATADDMTTISFTILKEEKSFTGQLTTLPMPEDQMLEVMLLGANKKFLPKTTLIPENRPFKLHTMSAKSFPHSDFKLLGTDIDLKFKKGKIITQDVEKGLKSGDYLISRPKYPKQKHGIASKIVVESSKSIKP